MSPARLKAERVSSVPRSRENRAAAITPDLLEAQLKGVLQIHQALFRKLIANDIEPSPLLAELFEEVANRYLDISLEISRRGARPAKD